FALGRVVADNCWGASMLADTVTMTETPKSLERSEHSQFQQFRSYLYLLARSHIGSRHRTRLDHSDIVQQSLLDAYKKRSQFRGTTYAEKMAWLRQILANNLADAVRGLGRAKRDIARERPLESKVGDSFTRVEGWLAAVQSS